MLFSINIGGFSLPSASNMILYINLGVLALFLIAFLIGYIRGLFKSVFNIAASCGMVLLFFLVFPLISKALINVDLTTFGLDFDIEGIKVVSIGQFIEDYLVYILKVDLPDGTLVTDTLLYLTVYSVVELVLRLALLIVILVLNLTVFKFIYWVIYMIIKPRQRDEDCYKRIRLTKMNRVYGGLVSILNFILIMFIFCVPLSAVFSLAETAGNLVETEESNNEKLSNKILLSFDGTKVQLSANNRELLQSFGIDEEYIDILDEYSDVYRKTIPGFIYSIPISSRGLDTLVFDSLFTIEYKDKKLQFRKELETVLEIVEDITATVDLSNGFSSMDDILLIIDSLSEEEINNIFNKLNELEIIEFAIPLASDTFELMVRYGDEQFTAYLDFADAIAVLKDSDYKNLIGQIGKSIASTKALLDEVEISVSSIASGEIDYDRLLSAKPTTVQKVLDNIAGIELLDTVFTAAEKKLNEIISENEMVRSFMIALPEVEIVDGKYAINGVVSDVNVLTEELEYLGFEVDENNNWIILYNDEEYITNIDASNSLHMINVNGISISQELRNIGKIYESFSTLGITSIKQIQKWFDETVEAEEVDYSKWSKENLDTLAQSIINLQVVGKASGNLMVVVNNMLPAQYRNKIIIPDSITANDLSCVLILARTAFKERLLSADDYTKLDYKVIIENNFDDLVNAIKNSDIIMDNLTPVLNVLFEIVFEGEEVIVIGDDVKWDEELENLFRGVKEILAIDIFAEKIDLSNLNVEALSTALSKSKVLTSNLNNILKWAITQIKIEGFEIAIPDDIVWDYDQIYSMFSAVKIVLDIYLGSIDEANELQINTLLNKLCNLTDEEIDLILSNELITKVVAALLYDQANREDGALYGMIVVNIPADDYNIWLGSSTRQGELSIILHSAKLLINGVDFNDEDELVNKIIENLTNLTNNIEATDPKDDQVGQILSSIILVDTIEKYLIDFSSEENAFLVYPEGTILQDVNGEAGELRKIITALKQVLAKTDIDFSSEVDTNTLINEFFKLDGNDLELLVASDILLATIDKYFIDFGKEGLIAYNEESKEKIRNEIGVVFDILKDILKDVDLNDLENINVNLIVENVCELTDEKVDSLLTSTILTDTVKMYIESFSEGENAFITIPEGVVWYDENNKPVEVERIIKGLRLLLNKVEIDFENIDTEALFDGILELNGDDIYVILDSQILYATVESYLIDFDEQGYIDYNQELDLKEEFGILIENLPKVLGEDFKFSDFENLDVNELIKNIVKLTDTELSEILDSEILCDTIIMYINDINKDGEVLVIAEGTDWKGTNGENGELYNIIKALKCIYEKQEIDFNNFDINVVLDAMLLLEDEDIDILFTSSVLTDTVDSYLKDFNEDEVLVYENVEKDELAGEFKKLLSAITDVFGPDFKFADLEDIDINVMMDSILSFDDNEIDTLFASSVLTDTINEYLIRMSEDEIISYDIDKDDLADEFKALLGCDHLVFGEGYALNDLENIDTNEVITRIVQLTNDIDSENPEDDQVGMLLESKILSDTIIMYIDSYSETDGSPIIMPDGNVKWYDTEVAGIKVAGELRNILGALSVLFGNQEEIDLNSIDANIIRDIEEDEVDEILKSKIISLTVGDILESLHVSLAGDDVEPIDDLSVELKSLIYGIDKIFDENTDLNEPEFNINVILDLEDEEMNRILDSEIVFDTFYYELHNLTEGDLEGILVFKPGMDETEEELIKFVNSIKVVLGDEDLTNMQAESFTIDSFIAMSDDEIDVLLDSTLVRYSAALQLEAVLYGDEAVLGEYIELDTYGDNNDRLNSRERIALIEDDLGNLIRVIRDLNEKGISYTEFTYESFETALNDGDSDENAKELSAILLQSAILTNSLDKMINRLLSDVLTEEQMGGIVQDLTEEQWCGSAADETDEGELTRILKVLIYIEQFAADGADNSTIDSPEELSNPLKAINHSLKLHGLLPTFVETTTSNLGEWVTGDQPEDVEAWDKEIDVLSELIWKVCSLNMNLDDMEVQGNNSINPDELGYILTRVNHSVMLDIHMVGPLLETGIGALFTEADVTIDTSDLVDEDAWDEEIVKIVEAVRALQAIEDITINRSEQGIANAEAIGTFLDLCYESTVLGQAVDSIIESIIPSMYVSMIGTLMETLGYTYKEALVEVAGYIPE